MNENAMAKGDATKRLWSTAYALHIMPTHGSDTSARSNHACAHTTITCVLARTQDMRGTDMAKAMACP